VICVGCCKPVAEVGLDGVGRVVEVDEGAVRTGAEARARMSIGQVGPFMPDGLFATGVRAATVAETDRAAGRPGPRGGHWRANTMRTPKGGWRWVCRCGADSRVGDARLRDLVADAIKRHKSTICL
jgi:hypothetical protein